MDKKITADFEWQPDALPTAKWKGCRLPNGKVVMGELSFLAVLRTERYAYTRRDGVHVIPIGRLAP